MSTPTARLARQWAEESDPQFLNEQTRAVRDYILENTTPPTMADVEWDDDKHYLAGATTPDDTDCVMIWSDQDLSGDIVCDDSAWRPDQLTPNGKKYNLVEIAGDEHPETLTTVEDYENAPEGTIVSLQGTSAAWVKDGGEWRRGTYAIMDSVAASRHARTVLRKGWVK